MRMPEVAHPSPTAAENFRRVLDERAIQPLFQPLIDLETRHVLGYEALARGPMGSALESPAALFGAAWRAGRVAELDWACRAAAFTGAAEAGLGPPFTLFVNAEPVSLGAGCPEGLRSAIELGRRRLRVVIEVTERAVAGDPARLLATVAQAREAGWGVALDDVGAAPASLAVLPFVRPDAVKLDMQLEHQGLDEAEPNVLLACFQDAAHFTPATRSRYEFLSTRAAFTGVLGHGMPVVPVAGVRGADLAADDPLRREWDLVVIGPRFAAALVARDRNDRGPDARRGFDVIVTHDRDLVIRAAEPLLRRLVPEP